MTDILPSQQFSLARKLSFGVEYDACFNSFIGISALLSTRWLCFIVYRRWYQGGNVRFESNNYRTGTTLTSPERQGNNEGDSLC